MNVDNLLRAALGIPFDYNLSDEELVALRELTVGVVPYFVAFTARSGSTFLTHELHSTGVLSRPHEWFNWDYVKETGPKGNKTFTEYFNKTLEENRSKNGVFGCEINWLQLKALGSLMQPQSLFKNKIRWFYLRRRNVVAQAISNFIADKTSFFHSYQGNDSAFEKVASLEYDAEAIKMYVQNFVQQELSFDKWFHDNNIVPVDLFYEDITREPSRTSMLFANVLGAALPLNFGKTRVVNPIAKIGGEQNRLYEERFRKEEREFVHSQFKLRSQILEASKTV